MTSPGSKVVKRSPTKEITPFTFVEVTWFDAGLHGPWRDTSEVAGVPNLKEVRTRGWLVREGRYSITLAMSWAQYMVEYTGDGVIYGATWTIPKGSIRKGGVRVLPGTRGLKRR